MPGALRAGDDHATRLHPGCQHDPLHGPPFGKLYPVPGTGGHDRRGNRLVAASTSAGIACSSYGPSDGATSHDGATWRMRIDSERTCSRFAM